MTARSGRDVVGGLVAFAGALAILGVGSLGMSAVRAMDLERMNALFAERGERLDAVYDALGSTGLVSPEVAADIAQQEAAIAAMRAQAARMLDDYLMAGGRPMVVYSLRRPEPFRTVQRLNTDADNREYGLVVQKNRYAGEHGEALAGTDLEAQWRAYQDVERAIGDVEESSWRYSRPARIGAIVVGMVFALMIFVGAFASILTGVGVVFMALASLG